ncbi:MAG: hypothetical protein ACPG7Y_09130, partial [Acidimicrobiales bacterium]
MTQRACIPVIQKSSEENEEPDAAQKEKTTPLVGHSRSSEMTKTPIHIEAEVGFLVGLLISRLRWVLFIFAFGAVHAIAFCLFVGLISAASKLIGRGFWEKPAILTWTRLKFQFNGHAQYPPRTHKSLSRMRSWIKLILGNHFDAFKWIWSTDVLTTWLMPRTGTKRGHVPDPRPTNSRFPVQMELVQELSKISFDRSYGGEHYTPMLTHILGYPKFESWSAKYKHYQQAFTTECLLIKTSGSSARHELVRAKVWDSCDKDDGKDSVTVRKEVSKI